MNVPDELRCNWATAGTRGLRCMCPATMSTSKFCVFHRHPSGVDVHGIVEWSHQAAAEDFVERAKAFIYAHPSPHVERLRAQIAVHASGRPARIASTRLNLREPGQDDEDIAA